MHKNYRVNDFSVAKIANILFIAYLTYLFFVWIIFNYGGRGNDPYTGSGVRWLLITIPLLAYIFFNCLLLLVKPSIKKNPIIFFLLCYLILVTLISFLRLDLKHFSEVARWVLPLILIANFRVKFPLLFLNILYLWALFFLILTYNPAVTDYGYLPGQTSVNLHEGLWWRVSIWKYVTPPYSAAFSLIVFFANFFLNKNKSRFIFYALALYFIILSGNRTSYLIFALCFSLVIVFDWRNFRYSSLYVSIPIVAVSVIIGLQLVADVIPMLGINNEFFNSAVLRNDSSDGDAANLSSRFLIIAEHYRMVENMGVNALFGLGGDVYSSPQWTVNGGYLGGTTDSFVSHLVARDGVSVIFLLLAFLAYFRETMKEKNLFGYLILLSLLLYTVGYGAWLNFTSPVFVLFIGCIYHKSRQI